MLKKDEITNPNSCLNRSADDEPVFVLRAHDDVAPGVVREWAFRYSTTKALGNPDQRLTDVQRRKYREAMELADEMARWRAKNP